MLFHGIAVSAQFLGIDIDEQSLDIYSSKTTSSSDLNLNLSLELVESLQVIGGGLRHIWDDQASSIHGFIQDCAVCGLVSSFQTII